MLNCFFSESNVVIATNPNLFGFSDLGLHIHPARTLQLSEHRLKHLLRADLASELYVQVILIFLGFARLYGFQIRPSFGFALCLVLFLLIASRRTIHIQVESTGSTNVDFGFLYDSCKVMLCILAAESGLDKSIQDPLFGFLEILFAVYCGELLFLIAIYRLSMYRTSGAFNYLIQNTYVYCYGTVLSLIDWSLLFLYAFMIMPSRTSPATMKSQVLAWIYCLCILLRLCIVYRMIEPANYWFLQQMYFFLNNRFYNF